MYVCSYGMYVRMYAYMYIRMYACMYEYTHACTCIYLVQCRPPRADAHPLLFCLLRLGLRQEASDTDFLLLL